MGDIYRQTERVVVWIPAFTIDKPELALQAVNKLTHVALEVETQSLRPIPQGIPSRLFYDPTEAEIGALDALLPKPLVTRTWVMQEVLLAQEVVARCGAEEIRWFGLYSACFAAHFKRLFVLTNRDSFFKHIRLLQDYNQQLGAEGIQGLIESQRACFER